MKVLKGFGIDVKEGDIVGVLIHDTGKYGTKGPHFIKCGIYKIVSFKTKGRCKIVCKDELGRDVYFSCRSDSKTEQSWWYREFYKPNNDEIVNFKHG